jgi:transposase
MPAYAPDLNPAEGVWANMKNGLGNLATHNVSDLAAIVRNRLKRIQYRPPSSTGSSPRPEPTVEPEPP